MDHWENLGVEGRVILEWVLREQGGKLWSACVWLRIGTEWRAFVNTVMNTSLPSCFISP
jgi:hypothetical protein